MLVLELAQVLQIDASLVQDLLAFGVDENHFLVLFELFPCLEVLVAIFFREFYRFDLGFGLFNQGNHALSLLLRRKDLKLPVQKALSFLGKGRIGVSAGPKL